MLDGAPVTATDMLSLLAPSGVVGGSIVAVWRWWQAERAAEKTAREKERADDRAEREAAHAALIDSLRASAAASDTRTERVVVAIVASTATAEAQRASNVEVRAALDRQSAAVDRLADKIDGRATSERIAGGAA